LPWNEREEETAPSFKATHAPKYASDDDDDEAMKMFADLTK
jgi:hypothetical protein